MGRLPERGQPFIGYLTSFHAAYPTVEGATVKFTETDFGTDPKVRYWDLADGARMPCGNPRCQRGGYNIEWLAREMISKRTESEEIKMSCNGDEGSPKGRRQGKNCLMFMEGTINVKYKKAVSQTSSAERLQ